MKNENEKAKILIVEDAAITALDLKKNIENLGYKVNEIIKKGEDAIDSIENNIPDLVFMDVKLKGEMDGIQAAEEITKKYNLPIIFLTGNSDIKTLESIKNTNTYGYIIKPFDRNQLFYNIELAISKHKYEKEIEFQRKNFKALFLNSPDGIVQVDNEFKIKNINRKFKEMFEYTKEECLGKRINSLITPEIYAEETKRLVEKMKKGNFHEIETKRKAKSGKLVDVIVKTVPNFEGFDGFDHFYIYTDITDKKEKDKIIKEKEDKYQSIVQAQNEMICRFLPDTTLTFVNDAYCKTFNMKREDLIGRKFSSFIPKEYHEEGEKHLKTITPDNPIKSFEHESIKPNGEIVWHEWTDYAFFDENNQVIEFQSVGRDITKRKIAEKKLKENKEKYRNLVENINDVLFTINLEGEITYISPSVKNISGYNPEEIIGKDLLFVIHPDDKDKVKKAFKDRLNNKFYPLEFRIIQKNGLEKYVRSTSKPYCKEGKTVGINGAISDINDYKIMEKALREKSDIFEGVINGIPDIISIQNPDYTIEMYNKAGYDFLNKTKEDVKGKKCYEIIGRDSVCEVCTTREALISKKQEKAIKYMPQFDKYLDCRSNPILDEEGNIIRVVEQLRDITKEKKQEERIKQERDYMYKIFDSMDQYVIINSINHKIEFLNKKAREELGDIVGKTCYEVVGIKHPCKQCPILKIVSGEPGPIKYSVEAFDKVFEGTATKFNNIDGTISILEVLNDVTDRVKNEEKIKNALKEKEELLKEIHHRVKNNLQTITSILNLKELSIKDEKMKSILQDTQNRVQAMPFVHEKLYTSESMDKINLADYVKEIVNNLIFLNPVLEKDININYKIDVILVKIDQAIPISLMINEVISNSLKHGFKNIEKGEIDITIKDKNDLISILIKDNGEGLPKGFDAEKTESLGWQLINALAHELEGELKVDNDKGTRIKIEFRKL